MPRRLALLVATYRYQDGGLRELTAPGHDAEALAEALRHPDIGGFGVTVLVNEPHYVVGEAIGEFYRNRRHDDLTFLYFTGHGLKDDNGRLYLAMANTKLDSLLFTALPAQQIDYALEACSSRQKVSCSIAATAERFRLVTLPKVIPRCTRLSVFRVKVAWC